MYELKDYLANTQWANERAIGKTAKARSSPCRLQAACYEHLQGRGIYRIRDSDFINSSPLAMRLECKQGLRSVSTAMH